MLAATRANSNFTLAALEGSPGYYSESPTSAGQVTGKSYWRDSSKTVLLLTEAYTYSGSGISSVLLTDVRRGRTITKSLSSIGATLVTNVA